MPGDDPLGRRWIALIEARRLPRLRAAHVRRRHAVLPAETADEIGRIVEPGIIGQRGDLLPGVARIAQHAIRARKPLRQHEVGEGRAVLLEQELEVARRHPVLGRDRGHRHPAVSEAVDDVLLDRPQPCSPHAAALGGLNRIARGTERERNQVLNMRRDLMLQLRRRQGLLIVEDAGIVVRAAAAPAFALECAGRSTRLDALRSMKALRPTCAS